MDNIFGTMFAILTLLAMAGGTYIVCCEIKKDGIGFVGYFLALVEYLIAFMCGFASYMFLSGK